MKLDLNLCFPEPKEDTDKRGPLPKQQQFMFKALDPKGPRFILYCGGYGSGKTLVGCITVLSWALLYPGKYLICRQFLTDLKTSTLTTFLEICPKELIHEYRIADNIVRIKGTNGKISDIYFRGLDDQEKIKSANLSGCYIDEASQVSEKAFMELMARTRLSSKENPSLLKIILTTNPNGHDWMYKWFVKQDHFAPNKADVMKKAFYLIQASSKENTHLSPEYLEGMYATWHQDKIKRDLEASFDAFEGMVYHEFRHDAHVIRPFVIPKEWKRVIGIDHGYRNPSAWIWGAVDYDGDLYVYREFYEKEWLIEEICKGNKRLNKPGALDLMKGEKIEQARIDPSTRAARAHTGQSDWDIYVDNLPSDFPLMPANNEKTAGIDKVKSYLKVNPTNNKPRMFIFSSCSNLIDEMSTYRYAEQSMAQIGRSNEKEEPRKVNDHALDALRYLIMACPDAPTHEQDVWKRVKYNSLEGSLYRDLQKSKKGTQPPDPFGDF